MAHADRVVSYFGELANMATEEVGAAALHVLCFLTLPLRQEIEDCLLVTPKLDGATLADPRVQQLIERGLQSPSVAIRTFCLSKALPRMSPNDLSDGMWLAVLSLVGDTDVDVSQRAVAFVLDAAPGRLVLPAAATVLEQLARHSPLLEMRVLDLAVRAATKQPDLAQVPIVGRLVDRALALCVSNEDPLVCLSALELIAGVLATSAWGVSRILDEKLVEKTAARAEQNREHAAAMLRFIGAIAAAGGERALEAVRASAAPELVRESLNEPSRVNEIFLDGCLCVLEGVARGSDGGRLHLCESGLLESVLDHVRSGDVYVRIRSTHCVAEILTSLSSAGENAAETVRRTTQEKGAGLVAKLLHLASQPLLTDQRTAVFRLLHLLIREVTEWAFTSNPTLFNFITDRRMDTQKDAIEWRFAMVQQAFAKKELFATEAQIGELTRYLRDGAYYAPARTDVKSEAN